LCSPSGPSWPVLGWTLPFTDAKLLEVLFPTKLRKARC